MTLILLLLFIDRSSTASPEDSERAQIIFYDDVGANKKEPGVIVTADNPQYGVVINRSDVTADPKSDENIYSYAVP